MGAKLFNYASPAEDVRGDGGIILSALSDEEWAGLLSYAERRQYPAGAQIVKRGEIERTLFILLSGTVEVFLKGGPQAKSIAAISAGSVFGEMSFFDREPRSATIKAAGAVEVASLSYAAFEALSVWRPKIALYLLADLGRVLSARLRRANAA